MALDSIFENQTEIKKVDSEVTILTPQKAKSKKKEGKYTFKNIDSHYAELLQAFAYLLNIKGRPFGQLNQPSFGMSDGRDGVQWNISISTDTGLIRLGVNLEGMKYRNWPISKLILSEMSNPTIEKVKAKLGIPNEIFIRFSRDAWQVTARPAIDRKSSWWQGMLIFGVRL